MTASLKVLSMISKNLWMKIQIQMDGILYLLYGYFQFCIFIIFLMSLKIPDGCTGAWSKVTNGSPVRLVRAQAKVNVPVETVGDYMWSETFEQKKKDDD